MSKSSARASALASAGALRQQQVHARSGAIGTKAWIVVGALWFALFVYCMTAWVLGPDFVPNTLGRDKASPGYVQFIRGLEVVMVALTVWLFWRIVLRPLVHERRLSRDGLFFLACFTLVLQEPWHSWLMPQFLYNDIFINYGSWMGTLPVLSPTAHKTPLPIAFAGLGYFWVVGGPALCGSRAMAWAQARNPNISALKLVGWCFLGFCVFDLILETFIVRTGLFIYASTIPQFTLFAGETYQFPLYETLCWAGTYTSLACIHFFRNDKGETWAERGFDTLRLPERLRTFTRWLALVGICQMAMLFTWNVPYFIWPLYGGPTTVTEESHPWFTAGLCGTSTPYDCPGPGVPLARRDSPTNRIAPQAPKP